ncbi:MAG: ATP-binding cassette domain-containing protein [Clostridia bacterium]|nr:ATP-binding cassette domain-containing protein [Clostridia bacterium]
MKAIEFKDVTFRYEGYDNEILKNANFSVDYGEVALLAGFSGEGKSTVLSLASGIIPNVTPGEVTGEIFAGGESVKDKKLGEVCRKVGVVLQNADSQIIHSVVEDEIAFGCENFAFLQEEIEKSVKKSCERMKLNPEWLTRTLSGGQKQRLITACAFATGQKVLILDEPLANLDGQGARLLMNTLKSLAKEGYAVLVVEHRLDMVLPFVDTVWNIRGGEITKIEDKKSYLLSQAQTIVYDGQSKATEENVFQLKNVGFSAGKREILKDITLDIKKGERLLLLGENGCGKTTLLRIIAKLNKKSKGEIESIIDKRRGKWYNIVSFVHQNPDYMLFMPTVRQEIAYNAKTPEYAEEIVRRFGLEKIADRHPQSLSEGQKRRVSIAAATSSDPEVLLLDEPTVGQDFAGLKELVGILNELHEKTGNTMITVTHDLRCAEALCDRAAVIEDGKISEVGERELARRFFVRQ